MARVRDDEALTRTFTLQSDACTAMGAPFTGRVCRWLATALDDTSALGRRVIGWPRANRGGDLVPLRCCAGFHALARSGRVPALSAAYPPHVCDDAALADALAAGLAREDAFLTSWLDSPPQTNEVGRSAILLGGILALAQIVERPIALHEIGASAGLNMHFDRWSYDLGQGGAWGAPDAPVRIASAWTGAMPARDTPFAIADRAAGDLRPLSIARADDRERLLSYVWPDQTERLARAEAAVAAASSSGLVVEAGDARDWVARHFSDAHTQPGLARVLWHSVFIQYLDPPVRTALIDDIIAIGRTASIASPFAWLRMEAGEDRARCELRLTVWPAGEDLKLADVDWHGRSAHWL
jgi:hypothetical protein